jgi:hypothetical protein
MGGVVGIHVPRCVRFLAGTTGFAWAILTVVVVDAAGRTSLMAAADHTEGAPEVMVVDRLDESDSNPGAEESSAAEVSAQPASSTVEPGVEGGEPAGAGLLKDSFLEDWGQAVTKWKAKWPLTISGGAYHWWHVDNGGPLASGYGVPGVPGTHSYYLFVDQEQPVDWGPITKVGAHVQMRFRDSGVPLRSFYTDDCFWFWEAYGYLDTPLGRLKMGSIYRQFGLFWDDSWWGNVLYMDGLKLDSDYGISLEDTPAFENDFKIDRYLQFYFAQDRVNGEICGADAESFAGSQERNTLIGRVVPTWKLGAKETFALGLSGTVGGIANQAMLTNYGSRQSYASPGDQTIAGWAVDGTWTYDRWKLFVEVAQRYGTLTPCHYISGGASNRYSDGLAGITYTRGPLTYRCVYSYGVYDNPGGRQGMWVPGITAKITNNLTLWFEYTYWESHNGLQDSVLENGYQMVVDWHF